VLRPGGGGQKMGANINLMNACPNETEKEVKTIRGKGKVLK
jgi:hypothetical protein